MGKFDDLKAMWANRRAKRVRAALDKLYRVDSQKAIEHVNEKLVKASREEAQRETLTIT